MSTPASVTGAAPPPKPPIPDDPRQIEQEIRARQASLAATVDELTTRLSPKEIARRSKATAQAKVDDAIRDENGSLRTERVGAVAGAALTVLMWVLWRRRRRQRTTGYRYEVQRVPSRR